MGNCSVVMATYNGAKYISEQLDSIFAQTLVPDEIIIVDDCSVDNTWEILNEYAYCNPKIKLYRNNVNLGVVKSFEYALTLSSGEFVALADQDDYWLPNKLELLIKNIGANWLIHSDAYIVDANLNVINKSYNKLKPYHDNSLNMYLMRNNVTGCTVLLHRSLLKLALPFTPNVIMHDHYLALCARFCDKLTYLDLPLLKYRQHNQNVVGSGEVQSYSAMIANYRKNILFLDGLLLSNIKFDSDQLELAKSYFVSIVNVTIPSLKIFIFIKRLFGINKAVVLFLYTVFGRRFAKIVFDGKISSSGCELG